MPKFEIPFFLDVRSKLREWKMTRAWRAVKADLLEQVDNVLLRNQNEDIYFNGHRYLFLNGQFWIDHRPAKADNWLELRREIEEMEV